jgi:hypothetical protein
LQNKKPVGEESEFGKNPDTFDASEKERVDPPIGETDPAIPKGIQLLPGQPEELRENAEMANEKDIEEEDWAMAAVMDMAEYLNPSYEEAKRRPDWPKWQEAIKAELESLEKNGTWSTVKRPKGANVVSCKWVLRIKKNAAGEIEKYKAWLVA